MQPLVKAELLLTQYRGRYLCDVSIGRGYPKQMRVLINCVIVCVGGVGWRGKSSQNFGDVISISLLTPLRKLRP